MAIERPDIYVHQNTDYPIVDGNSVAGQQIVSSISERNNIAINYRKQYATIQVGLDKHVYMATDVSDVEWENDDNWTINRFMIINSDKQIYINPDSGSDSVGDGSIGNPYASLEYAIETVSYSIVTATLSFYVVYDDLTVDKTYNCDTTRLFELFGTIKNIDGRIQILGYMKNYLTSVSTVKDTSLTNTYNITHASHTFVDNELDGKFIGDVPIGSNRTITVDKLFISNNALVDGTYDIVEPAITLVHDLENIAFKDAIAKDAIRFNNFKVTTTGSYLKMGGLVAFHQSSTFLKKLELISTNQNFYKCWFEELNFRGGNENYIIQCAAKLVYCSAASNNVRMKDATIRRIEYKDGGVHQFILRGDCLFYDNANALSSVLPQYDGVSFEILHEEIDKQTSFIPSALIFQNVRNLHVDFPNILGSIPTVTSGLIKMCDRTNNYIKLNGNFEEYNNRHIFNFQTITDVEALDSEHQFVFCEETGKLYHYESNPNLTRDGEYILDTSDGGTSRYVSLDYANKELSVLEVYSGAGSDATSDLAVGYLDTFYFPYDFEADELIVSVNTAPTGSNLIADMHDENDVTILGNKATIEQNEFITLTAATLPTLVTTAFSKGDNIKFYIDSIGTTVAGAGIKFYLLGKKS